MILSIEKSPSAADLAHAALCGDERFAPEQSVNLANSELSDDDLRRLADNCGIALSIRYTRRPRSTPEVNKCRCRPCEEIPESNLGYCDTHRCIAKNARGWSADEPHPRCSNKAKTRSLLCGQHSLRAAAQLDPLTIAHQLDYQY